MGRQPTSFEAFAPAMKVIVGLGNPGRRYEKTRHNIGFEVVAELVRRFAAGSRPKAKFDGEIIESNVNGQPTCFVCPLTFMNESGRCVRQIVDFYKIVLSDLLVVCDDFQLPLAKLRFRPEGSHGGQNGLEDILQRLATNAVPRLRIGIGPLRTGWNPADFVLSRFDSDEQPLIDVAFVRAADAVRVWIQDGMAAAMNQFNRDPDETTDAQPKDR
jgi:peptidyl-tRNA hydrolase, PTH1 family